MHFSSRLSSLLSITTAAVLGTLVLGACSHGAPRTATAPGAAESHDFDPCAADDATVSCADWARWTRINDLAFRSRGHRNTWVDIHVEPAYADAYRAGVAPMPVGMRVVKAAHDGVDGPVTGLTVMAKMPPGYDPANGDWFYAVYDPSGTRASKEGKLESCISCHANWLDHDRLGGAPGLWE